MLEKLRNREIGFSSDYNANNRRCYRTYGRMGSWNCSWRPSSNNRIIRQKPTSYGFRGNPADVGWAISTGPESKYNAISDLKGSSIGISRIGRHVLNVLCYLIDSGSYVMPYVLADQNSWLEKGKDPFDFKVLTTFENMINSVRYTFQYVILRE